MEQRHLNPVTTLGKPGTLIKECRLDKEGVGESISKVYEGLSWWLDVQGQKVLGIYDISRPGHFVAVKVRPLFYAPTKKEAEGQLVRMKKLQHQNIIRFFYEVQSLNYKIFVFEKALGSFDQYIRHNNANPDTELFSPAKMPGWPFLMLQLTNGLAYLHSEKISHKDLKLGSVLLFKKLFSPAAEDFLVLKWSNIRLDYSPLVTTSSPGDLLSFGSRTYIAPELMAATSREHITGIDFYKADIWAFGIVMFQALAKGVHPYSSGSNGTDSLFSIETNIVQGEPASLKLLSDHAAFDIVAGMIEHAPEKRIELLHISVELKSIQDCPPGLQEFMTTVITNRIREREADVNKEEFQNKTDRKRPKMVVQKQTAGTSQSDEIPEQENELHGRAETQMDAGPSGIQQQAGDSASPKETAGQQLPDDLSQVILQPFSQSPAVSEDILVQHDDEDAHHHHQHQPDTA